MSLNGISTENVVVGGNIDPIATKIKRRNDKLALAISKRSQMNTIGYRNLNSLGTGTHAAYVLNSLQTLSGYASPNIGHPWEAII
jgi:hypothetical protein